ncbi:MAG: hypothetical protein DRO12_06830 [Thermoprotei archaeon]|nr:MAG: hypothetical protein DRO12_06830 [Thermoprotei archaeon]
MAVSPREIINNLVSNPPIPQTLKFGKITVKIHNYEITVQMFDYTVYRIAYHLEDEETSPPRRTMVSWIFVSAPRISDEELEGKTAAQIEDLWKRRFMENLNQEFRAAVNIYLANRALTRG